jgi:hypothetical protein
VEENNSSQSVPEASEHMLPVETAALTPPPNPKPKRKFSLGAIIGTILFLLVAGGAAASFTVFKPQIMKLVTKPTPPPAFDFLKGWANFKNASFSVKYPSILGNFLNICMEGATPDAFFLYQNLHSINECGEIMGSNKNAAFYIIPSHLNPDLSSSINTNCETIKKETISIDGKISNKYIVRTIANPPKECKTNNDVYIAYENNSNKYLIGYDRMRIDENTVNHILSTIKFFDNKIQTVNWKTYINSEEGYSIKIPENYYPYPYPIASTDNSDHTIIINDAPLPTDMNPLSDIALSITRSKDRYEILKSTYSELPGMEQKPILAKIDDQTALIFNDNGIGYHPSFLNGFPLNFKTILLSNGRNFYTISYTIGYDKHSLGEIEAIISTFKFTDPTTTPSPATFQTPAPTCIPRPACLDATPRCMIAEPANGWCP